MNVWKCAGILRRKPRRRKKKERGMSKREKCMHDNVVVVVVMKLKFLVFCGFIEELLLSFSFCNNMRKRG
jgi:hypothetical protein